MAGDFLLVGLTGPMGSGKSAVAAAFADCGAFTIDTDRIARDLVSQGKAGWQAICDEFGEEYLAEDGSLDRPLLRRTIFRDPSLRERLDRIIHPLVREELERMLARISSHAHPPVIVVEVPLLYEAGWEAFFDLVVAVRVKQAELFRRLEARDGMEEDEAKQALAAQMSAAEKASRADYLIDNNGPMVVTGRAVADLYARIVRGLPL